PGGGPNRGLPNLIRGDLGTHMGHRITSTQPDGIPDRGDLGTHVRPRITSNRGLLNLIRGDVGTHVRARITSNPRG
ncbi:MAG TPA: hypothetical protein VFL38_12500, partial [Humibacillus xanthopallidus]|nr:hypothetical protein [Humibacillus xanthopallidus]